MKKYFYLILFLSIALPSFSQKVRKLPADSTIVTTGEVTVKGKRFPYTVTTGTQPVYDEEGKAIAALEFTYYERNDVTNKATRPLVISFNGGPGSASVWMHIAYTGPRVLEIDNEGYPVQPYGIKENPNSILDVADIVYVNPVNTGYSRILVKDTPKEKFFGVNADIKYLGEWLTNFVTRKNKWTAPKYLIGESYGTTRVSGLALELQNAHWMYLNGVILVSPTDLGIERAGVDAALNLPYFAAAAWYHKCLPADLQAKDLTDVLTEAEQFTMNELIPGMAQGGFISEAKRKDLASKMARYSGISEKVILQHNLDVPAQFFWKELLREKGGYTVGRLDSRYKGIDMNEAGVAPDYAAELTSWLHSFTPAINYYLREVLKYKTDIKYNMFGPVNPWDRSNDNTGRNLRLAMAENPYLNVMFQCGYYDGATQYFNAKYTMWHIDPSGKMKDRFSFKGYRSGHMMYLRAEDLISANDDLREFILKTMPKKGQPAKY
jgi:carboxypeptidase C (cathepsin A)